MHGIVAPARMIFHSVRYVGLALVCWIIYEYVIKQLWFSFRISRQGVRGSTYKPFIGDLLTLNQRRLGGVPFTEFWREWDDSFGRVHYAWFGPEFRLRISDPTAVKAILSAEHESDFCKPALMRRTLGMLLGEGILLSQGDTHRRHRRMLNPAFHFQALKAMGPLMVQSTVTAVKRWTAGVGGLRAVAGAGSESDDEEDEDGSGSEDEAETWHVVDLHEELSAITLDVICRCAFGAHVPSESTTGKRQGGGSGRPGPASPTAVSPTSATDVYASLDILLRGFTTVIASGLAFVPGFSWIPTPTNVKAWAEIARLRKLLMGLVEARRQYRARQRKDTGEATTGADASSEGANNSGTNKQEILLDYLLDATDSGDTGAAGAAGTASSSAASTRLTDDELLDEGLTFVTAGHETTSNALSWAMLLLDQNPLVRDSARAQVDSVLGRHRLPTVEDLPNMPLLGHILNESMRLYPPAPMVARQAVRDVTIPLGTGALKPAPGQESPTSLTIPAGSVLAIPIYGMHRDPSLWPGSDPETFDPSRWKDGQAAACAHPCGYIPFSTGPRNCIGQTFALQEAKLILAVLLQRVEWKVMESYVHQPAMMITLRPAHGLPVMLRERRA